MAVTSVELVQDIPAGFVVQGTPTATVGGVPLAGYGPEEMDPITEDAVDQRLQWRQHPSVAELFGRWVILDIRLDRAEVFAVRSAAWVNGGR